MDNPLVSIILCTYNRAAMLKETMPSILAQQYKPVEIMVVDDGSTDNTQEVIAAYGNRVRYYRQDNKGLAAARTVACQLAKGEYIAFQDDDDMMPPDRISKLYEALCLHPDAVLAVGDWELLNAEGVQTGQRVTFDIRGKNGGPLLIQDGYKTVMWPLITPLPNATLFRKADGERVGWLDSRFVRSSDTDFFARLGQLGNIVYLPQVVAYYRTGHARMWSDNVSNSIVCEYSSFLLYEKHLTSLKNEQKELRSRLQDRLLSTLMRLASLHRINQEKPDSIYMDYLKRGLALLGIKERIRYRWYVDIRLRLKYLIGRQQSNTG